MPTCRYSWTRVPLKEPGGGPLDSVVGALFPPDVVPRFVAMDYGAGIAADFDANGVADFAGRGPGDEYGIYLSAWAE